MNTTTKRIVKLVFMLPILFILLIGVIEASRLLYTWLKIENALRLGMCYTVTGKYDVSYCSDVDHNGTYCDGFYKVGEIDAARIQSIKMKCFIIYRIFNSMELLMIQKMAI